MLDSGDADMRRDARPGLTSISALRIKALLARGECTGGSEAVGEAIDRLETLRGHVAAPAELEAIVESLARSTGFDLDRNGAASTPLEARYPQLMASEFGPLIERIRQLAEMPGE
jgi:hypothetical protein